MIRFGFFYYFLQFLFTIFEVEVELLKIRI